MMSSVYKALFALGVYLLVNSTMLAHAQVTCNTPPPGGDNSPNTITKTATCSGPGVHNPGTYKYNINFYGWLGNGCVIDVIDTLPPLITNISAIPNWTNYVHPVIERFGQSANNGTYCRDATIDGTFDTPGVHTNTVRFSMDGGLGICPGNPDGSSTVSCDIADPSTFTIFKDGEFDGKGETGSINDPVTFTIDVDRDWYANDLQVVDTLPSNFVITSSSATQGTLNTLANTITWTHLGDKTAKTTPNAQTTTITIKGFYSTGPGGLQINNALGSREEFDDTPHNTGSFTLLYLQAPIPGQCGPASGQSFYSFPGTGNGLTSSHPDLCAAGTVSGFTYNTGLNTWTWSCTGANSGPDMSCGAYENRCGDGFTGGQMPPQSGEVCDFATNNGTAGACSATCQWNTPSCTITPDPINGTANLTVNATGSINSPMATNYKRKSWDRGTGGTIPLSVFNSAYGTSYIYTYSGTYTIQARIENEFSSAHSGTCTASITVLGEDAVCGSGLNNQTLYDPDNNGDLINSGTVLLCDVGTATGFIYNIPTHTRTWTCESTNGGNNVSCNAIESRCGDDIVGTGVGYTGQEQCDLGSANSSTGACSTTCMLNTPTCELSFIPPSPWLVGTTGTINGSGSSRASGLLLVGGYSRAGSPPNVSYLTSFNNTGTYPVTYTVSNPLSGSFVAECTGELLINPLPITGQCAEPPQATYYTGSLPDENALCASGSLTGLTKTSTGWTWGCDGLYSGGNQSGCFLNISRCGDGTVGTGIGFTGQELCDLGSGNSATGACTLTCQFGVPSCDLVVAPSTGNAYLTVTATGTTPRTSNFKRSTVDRGYGSPFNPDSTDNPYGTSHTYTVSGNYTITFTIQNTLTGSTVTNTCTGAVTVDSPVEPTCPGNQVISQIYLKDGSIADSGLARFTGNNQLGLISGWHCDDPLLITKTGFVYSGAIGYDTGMFGDYVEYTVTITNPSDYMRYSGLVIKDLLPDGFVGTYTIYDDIRYNRDNGWWTVRDVNDSDPTKRYFYPGDTETIVFSGYFTGDMSGCMSITNTAEILVNSTTQQVSGGTKRYNNAPDLICSTCSAERELQMCGLCPVQQLPGTDALKLRKFADKTQTMVGSANEVVYTLVATNAGVATRNGSIYDTIATGFVITDPGDAVCAGSMPTICEWLPYIPGGETRTTQIKGYYEGLPNGTTTVNTIRGPGDETSVNVMISGGNAGVLSEKVLFKVANIPDGHESIVPGEPVYYNIVYVNIGGSNGQSVSNIKDIPPSQYIPTFQGTTLIKGVVAPGGQTGAYNKDSTMITSGVTLNPGGAFTLAFRGYYGRGGNRLPRDTSGRKRNTARGGGLPSNTWDLHLDTAGGICVGGTNPNGGGGGAGKGPNGQFIYDLALTKVISGDNHYQSGDIREFIITIYNQGDFTGWNIHIIDYIPFGLSFITGGYNTGWRLSGTSYGTSTAQTIYYTGIAPGQTGQVSIWLQVNGDVQTGIIRNYSEIIYSYNGGFGNDGYDSTGDRNQFNDCEGFDNQLTGSGPSGPGGTCLIQDDEDDQDWVDLLPPSWFDLALRKTFASGSSSPLVSGSTVTFTITVFNQGTETGENIQIVDYIPAGLTLNDPSWSLVGGMATKTLTGIVAPGYPTNPSAFTSTSITFLVDGTLTGTLKNRAEIKEASGGVDIDSTPNMNNGGDLESPSSQNNVITQVSPVDEDDHDFEEIVVSVENFDGRTKKILNTTGIIQLGDTVYYTIEYFMSGSTRACTLTDTYDAHHIYSGSNPLYTTHNAPTRTLTRNVTATGYQTGTISVWFKVTGTGAFNNNVSLDCGPGDSDPNNNTSNTGGTIDRFDLALTKVFASGSTSPLISGSLVTFTINVFNQGSLPATTIQLIDYIPTGLTLSDPSWTLSGTMATRTIAGPLAPGASTSTTITFLVNSSATGDITNRSEIKSAFGGTDIDSTPDMNNGEWSESPFWMNNQTGFKLPFDEDDHDFEQITIGASSFDPYLTKTLLTTGTIVSGQTITYRLDYGLNSSTNKICTIVDQYDTNHTYTGLSVRPHDGRDPTARQITRFFNPLTGGTTGSITVSFKITGNGGTNFSNTAWINCGGGESDIIANTGAAAGLIQVFDLALRKTFTSGSSSPLVSGSTVTFTITVFNQGTLTATTIQLIDTFPSGLTFHTGANTGWSLGGANTVVRTLSGPLAPGASTSVLLTFVVNGSASGSLINKAEIFGASGGNDTDSVYDTNPFNDVLIDDEIDNGSGDEDDMDIAVISIGNSLYDATIYKILTDTGILISGDVIEYQIDYTLSGASRYCTITDTYDAHHIFTELSDPNFTTHNSGSRTIIWSGLRVTGGNVTGTIYAYFEMLGTGTFTNNVSIDCGSGETNTGNNTDNATGYLHRLDLALTKTLSGSQNTFSSGQLITFRINLYNQGSLTASGIQIIDYIPNGLTFVPSLNTGWTLSGSMATRLYSGTLLPGASGFVTITLLVNGTTLGSVFNRAEIKTTSASGFIGPVPDVDSTPDMNNGTFVESPIDNATGFASPIDEDDHDFEGISIVGSPFDVTLTKQLSGASQVLSGSMINYNLTYYLSGYSRNCRVYDYYDINHTFAGLATPLATNHDATSRTIYWDITPLTGNTTGSISVWFQVRGASGTVFRNTGYITCGSGEIDIMINTGTASGMIIATGTTPPPPSLGLDKNIQLCTSYGEGGGNGYIQTHTYYMTGIQLEGGQILPVSPAVYIGDNGRIRFYEVNKRVVPNLGNWYITGLYNNPPGSSSWFNYMSGSNLSNPIKNIFYAAYPSSTGYTTGAGMYTFTNTCTGYSSALLRSSGAVTYTLTVTNTGGAMTNTAYVYDSLPTGFIYTSSQPSYTTGSLLSGVIGRPILLGSGQSTTIKISGRLSGGLTPGYQLVNTATISGLIDTGTITITGTTPIFDLALIKTFTSGSSTPLLSGSFVTYTFTVFNQGTLVASGIQLVDYIPAGLTLADSGWTTTGGMAFKTLSGTLLPGASTTTSITFMVNGSVSGTVINRGEIKAASGGTDIDSTPDMNNGTFVESPIDNATGYSSPIDEDDHDFAMITLGAVVPFDPYLTKSLLTTGSIMSGQTIVYRINYGLSGATNKYCTITDTHDTNHTLITSVPPYLTYVGQTLTRVIPSLTGNSTGAIDVTFRVTGTSGTVFSNTAAINCGSGETDIMINTGTASGMIIATGTTPPPSPIFDLALIKTFTSGSSTPLLSGSFVTYTFTVFNQGTLVASGIQLVDYIPAGLTLADSGWTATGGMAFKTLSGTLLPGASTTTSITFMVNGSVSGTVINRGEIKAASGGTDIDSTPDMNNGTFVESPIDNATGYSSPIDEDDHDFAMITLGAVVPFDPYLTKSLLTTGSIMSGQTIVYRINYGLSGATNKYCTITDTHDTNHTLITSVPPYLTYVGQTLTRVIPSLTGNSTGAIDVTFRVTGASGTVFSNTAAINCGSGEIDIMINTGTASGMIIATGTTPPPSPIFDLALIKTFTSGSSTPLLSGSFVTYTFTVFNQGTLAASGIQLVDYIPAGLTLADSGWTTTGGMAFKTLSGTLLPGASTTTSITFMVNGSVSGTVINRGEIKAASGGTDIDSTPDMSTGDAFSGDDTTSGNGTNDEDDHDPATITISSPTPINTGLRLIKSSNRMYANSGDTIVWTISYGIAGTGVMSDVVIRDILPAEVSYQSTSLSTGFVISGQTLTYTAGVLTGIYSNSFTLTTLANSGVQAGVRYTNRATITASGQGVISGSAWFTGGNPPVIYVPTGGGGGTYTPIPLPTPPTPITPTQEVIYVPEVITTIVKKTRVLAIKAYDTIEEYIPYYTQPIESIKQNLEEMPKTGIYTWFDMLREWIQSFL